MGLKSGVLANVLIMELVICGWAARFFEFHSKFALLMSVFIHLMACDCLKQIRGFHRSRLCLRQIMTTNRMPTVFLAMKMLACEVCRRTKKDNGSTKFDYFKPSHSDLSLNNVRCQNV